MKMTECEPCITTSWNLSLVLNNMSHRYVNHTVVNDQTTANLHFNPYYISLSKSTLTKRVSQTNISNQLLPILKCEHFKQIDT